MAEVVYLHVGPPKTGTTYLQTRLHLNRIELARHGVDYPTGPAEDMFAAALDLVDRPWSGLRADAEGEWARLVQRVVRSDGAVIVSHEVLAGATAEGAERAIHDLGAGAGEVHLVYTCRDISRQVTAEWQERLKHRRQLGFAKFVRRVRRPERSRSSTSFWQVQDLPDIHRRWATRIPPERVHLVTVPPAGSPPGMLWERFCRAVAIDPAWAPQDSRRRNPSLGAAESTLLRRLNRRLEEADLDSADYRTLVRHLVVHETLAHRTGTTPVTLPPDALDWADEVADSWIRWAKDAGVDVVGDLEDLRTTRPDPEQPWRDPDKPRSADVADAALDALVAVVLEAAARPEPDAGLVARAGLAIRRGRWAARPQRRGSR